MSNHSTRPSARPNRARVSSIRPEPSGSETSTGRRRKWTVAEFCAEWRISKRTFHEWRAKGRAPVCHKIPNGELRIAQVDYDAWVNHCKENSR